MGTAQIENPDAIMCTLEFTMKLKEWRQIKKTLHNNEDYVELHIIREISDLIGQLEKVFYDELKED